MRQNQLAIFLLAFVVSGCTKEKRDAASASPLGASGLATISSLQTDIFSRSCATSGCHDNRANPAGLLDLTTLDRSYANLVNRLSKQVLTLKLVDPGNPAASYLINKLDGTHSSVGGTGVQMPQYAAPLSSADRDRITTWITDGAPKN